LPATYPISAIYMNTAPDPTSPWVLPGTYKAWLTVDGKMYQQTFTVRIDPRVKTSMQQLGIQHNLSLLCYNNMQKCMDALKQIQVKKDTALNELEKDFRKYLAAFGSVQNVLQDSDLPPTTQAIGAAKEAEAGFNMAWKKWLAVKK
ncbi:MAG TPA: hypothetical protein PLZ45_12290, partial [Ferruginibacter sp.]|nr:hypothetical protein [Ferruginibacter sp.]